MAKVNKKSLEELKKMVKRGFPGDYALQQVRLARKIIEKETEGLSGKELIEYYRRKARKGRAG